VACFWATSLKKIIGGVIAIIRTAQVDGCSSLPAEVCYPFGGKHGRHRAVRRREFITLLGGAAAWPFVAKAQPTGKSWRIGQVIGGSAETNGHFARALEQSLDELGYRLG